LYFRYAASYHARSLSARRHAEHDLRFNTDYARRVTRAFIAELKNAVDFPNGEYLLDQERSRELGDPAIGRWIHQTADALEQGDMLSIDGLRLAFPARHPSLHEGSLCFLGVVFAVGVRHVEYGILGPVVDGASKPDLDACVLAWIDDRSSLLAKYRAAVVEVRTSLISGRDAEAAWAYSRLLRGEFSEVAWRSFRQIRFEAGFTELNRGFLSLAGGQTKPAGSSPFFSMLAGLANDVGFFANILGDPQTAEERLLRSVSLNRDVEWITFHNLAFALAEQGRVDSALVRQTDALRRLDDVGDLTTASVVCVVHVPIERRPLSREVGWNVFELEGAGLRYAAVLQQAIYSLQAGADPALTVLEPEPDAISPDTLRLAAWGAYILHESACEAAAFAERAQALVDAEGRGGANGTELAGTEDGTVSRPRKPSAFRQRKHQWIVEDLEFFRQAGAPTQLPGLDL
jgi:hypothetical protein